MPSGWNILQFCEADLYCNRSEFHLAFVLLQLFGNFIATKKKRPKTCERERKSGGWMKDDERPQASDGLSRAELLEARGWQTFTFHQANLWAPVSWLIHPDASWRRTDWLHNRPPSTIYPSRLHVTHLNPVWCRSIYFHLLISGACSSC